MKKRPEPDAQEAWRPLKAYKNAAYLNSPEARLVRILAEFMEPQSRLRRLKVSRTVVFYGSARVLPLDAAARRLRELQNRQRQEPRGGEELRRAIQQAKNTVKMAHYYTDAERLAERLTRFSMGLKRPPERFVVCSGGGPGIMEAASRGAHNAGGLAMGLNISLPFEQTPNLYLTRELAFEFHYFFIRKFWFAYLARALVVFPGGFGTCDELFDLLTLVQTGKTQKPLTIVLYGSEYWNEIINFEAMVRWGMINPEDLDLFQVFDDVDETYTFLRDRLVRDGRAQ